MEAKPNESVNFEILGGVPIEEIANMFEWDVDGNLLRDRKGTIAVAFEGFYPRNRRLICISRKDAEIFGFWDKEFLKEENPDFFKA